MTNGIRNEGTIGSLTNAGLISAGGYYAIYNSGVITSLLNTVTGTISSVRAGIYNTNGTIATLTNEGSIAGSIGINNLSSSTISTLTNSGIITGSIGINNVGSAISTLDNSGAITGTIYGIYNGSSGTISSLTNSGTITGPIGIDNNLGTISTLANSGTITGSIGINNTSSSTISSLSNTGTITSSAIGIYNGSLSTISTLTNSGTIVGTTYGIQSDNNSSITLLSNTSSGTISGGVIGVQVGQLTPSGTIYISTLTNAGYISGAANVGVGTSANGTIGSLINSGIITGANGIGNAGTIGTLVNSGTISGVQYAIYNQSGASLGLITNSGLIAGTVANLSTIGLTINGGSGSTFGTLTGAGGSIGTLLNTTDNLYFSAGNLLLNDNVNVGSYTLSNTGAVLQVNNQLSITGNYAQSASAALLIGVGNSAVSNGVAADTGYGRLIVSGAAVIASGSAVSLKPTGSYAFATGQRYVVVQAATSGTNYNASSLVYSATGYSGVITGSVLIDGSNSDLLLTLGTVVSSSGSGTTTTTTITTPNISATTPNAVSAISGLFNYTGVNTSLLNVFNASAALGSTTEANRAGAQLSPTSNAVAATQASSAPTQTVLNVAGAHVDGLRIAQANGDSGVATGERGNNFATWGQIFGGKANQSQRDNVSGYSANYNGLLIGGDALLNDAWRVGGLLSYTNTSVSSRDDNTGSSVGLKSYGLIGYAGYTADSWYLDLSGGVVQHKYSTTRLINFTGFNGVANGSYNGTQSVLSAEGGYPIRLDAATVLTPVAGLNYSKLRQNGYTESGGNGAALSVAANKSTSFKSDLGAKLERSFVTSYGSLAPSVQLTWRHEYQNTRLRSVASYAADTSGATSFVSYGAKPIANSGIMALAATLTRSDNITLTARYTMEAASGYMSQTADLRLRYQF